MSITAMHEMLHTRIMSITAMHEMNNFLQLLYKYSNIHIGERFHLGRVPCFYDDLTCKAKNSNFRRKRGEDIHMFGYRDRNRIVEMGKILLRWEWTKVQVTYLCA
jgi:hypothetical protein